MDNTEVEHMPHNHGSRVQILPGVGLFSPLSSLKITVMKNISLAVQLEAKQA